MRGWRAKHPWSGRQPKAVFRGGPRSCHPHNGDELARPYIAPVAEFQIDKGPPAFGTQDLSSGLKGTYSNVGKFKGKYKFKNKATGAIVYFDGQWKLNSEDSVGKWQFSCPDNADQDTPWDPDFRAFGNNWVPSKGARVAIEFQGESIL